MKENSGRNNSKEDGRLDEQETSTLGASKNCQYRIDRSIHHVEKPTQTRYLVRRYGYTKKDSTAEHPENISEHLETTY